MLLCTLASCLGKAKEQYNKAKESVSAITTFVDEAQKVEERIEKLKNETPLSNEKLKEWLPKNLENMDRTGYKVGQAGVYQVNSVEGTYKNAGTKKEFNIMVIDGAGPTGSVMAVSYGMIGTVDMELENENKHQQTVTVNGIKAQQTYKKKQNNTQLMFAYKERFLITIKATKMNVEETWQITNTLNLAALDNLSE